MKLITSYEQLENLGRERLSPHFFMRDFLHSEIAAWHQMRNVPDDPDAAIEVGKQLCVQLLEPLQATFGRLHIRSGYRSPTVNEFGNRNGLNCASNEANHAGHIWDRPDERGRGATACIVVPWLVDHIERGGRWTDMAWWIHDHLPYSSLYFFPKLAAFNINWHERPLRRIDSYAAPRGCLTRVGMPNHAGSHAAEYIGFPVPVAALPWTAAPRQHTPSGSPETVAIAYSGDMKPVPAADALRPIVVQAGPAVLQGREGRAVRYRAIHDRNDWRIVNSHKSLEAAVYGKDGAAALFARKVRIDYARHGDPQFVLVWEQGAEHGYAIAPDAVQFKGIRVVQVPVSRLQEFDVQGRADLRWVRQLF